MVSQSLNLPVKIDLSLVSRERILRVNVDLPNSYTETTSQVTETNHGGPESC